MIDPKALGIRHLRWDTWNQAHIAREGHEATPNEVEDVVFSDRSIMQQVKKGRILVLGPTSDGRMLAAVLDPEEEGIWYCVSARTASRKERELYQQEQARRSS